MRGEFFALVSAVCWSLHMIYTRKAQTKNNKSANPMDPMAGLFITILVNNVINVIALTVRHFVWDPVPINSAGIMFFIFAGISNSFIGRGLLFACVATLGAARAGLTKAIVPVFSLLGGVLLLGERLGPWSWLGVCIVLFGLFMMSFDTARRDSKKHTGTAQSNTTGKGTDRLRLITGIALGLAASLFFGAGNVFRKAGVTVIPDTVLAVSIGSLCAMLICVFILLFQRKGRDMLLAIKNIEFNYAMSGVFASAALYALVTALQLIPVSIANPISTTETLFTILFVWLMKEGKKEELGIQTFFFGVIMVIGTIILIAK
jgi:drug/metabolite transporter (DMT)-like permease